MDTFRGGDFDTLAIRAWLLLTFRIFQLFLAPSPLIVADYRIRQHASQWISNLLIVVAFALFASYAVSLLTFHPVQ